VGGGRSDESEVIAVEEIPAAAALDFLADAGRTKSADLMHALLLMALPDPVRGALVGAAAQEFAAEPSVPFSSPGSLCGGSAGSGSRPASARVVEGGGVLAAGIGSSFTSPSASPTLLLQHQDRAPPPAGGGVVPSRAERERRALAAAAAAEGAECGGAGALTTSAGVAAFEQVLRTGAVAGSAGAGASVGGAAGSDLGSGAGAAGAAASYAMLGSSAASLTGSLSASLSRSLPGRGSMPPSSPVLVQPSVFLGTGASAAGDAGAAAAPAATATPPSAETAATSGVLGWLRRWIGSAPATASSAVAPGARETNTAEAAPAASAAGMAASGGRAELDLRASGSEPGSMHSSVGLPGAPNSTPGSGSGASGSFPTLQLLDSQPLGASAMLSSVASMRASATGGATHGSAGAGVAAGNAAQSQLAGSAFASVSRMAASARSGPGGVGASGYAAAAGAGDSSCATADAEAVDENGLASLLAGSTRSLHLGTTSASGSSGSVARSAHASQGVGSGAFSAGANQPQLQCSQHLGLSASLSPGGEVCCVGGKRIFSSAVLVRCFLRRVYGAAIDMPTLLFYDVHAAPQAAAAPQRAVQHHPASSNAPEAPGSTAIAPPPQAAAAVSAAAPDVLVLSPPKIVVVVAAAALLVGAGFVAGSWWQARRHREWKQVGSSAELATLVSMYLRPLFAA
jgi:hypothetical protein